MFYIKDSFYIKGCDRAFIFGISIPYYKTVPIMP